MHPQGKAWEYLLQKDYQCEVVILESEWDIRENARQIKKIKQLGCLLLVLVQKDHSPYPDSEEHHRECFENVIRIFRRTIDEITPVYGIVDREYPGQTLIKDLPNIQLFTGRESEVFAAIRKQLSGFRITPQSPEVHRNPFGAETLEDVALTMNHLEIAYQQTHTEDEMLAIPCSNEAIALQAIRMRIIPSEFFSDEFDKTLRLPPSKEEIDQAQLLQEFDKLRQYSLKDREKLKDALLQSTGRVRSERDGILATRATLGDHISGFAIDPLTLLYYETRGFGAHQIAASQLSDQLFWIEELRARPGISDISWYHNPRIIQGMIYREINDFQTPILQLFLKKRSVNFEKLTFFIMEKLHYLVIDEDTKTLD
ncbi:MAG: hypothetical protein UY09_C0045G0013 [Parcubacteria group bacterium GW2011_GWA2_47_8]|nr:MAG: hypothetical protein UY09_C0045G0013 [Parcubacteria group bacterium GW2011_GWA2_47_8]